VAAATLPTATPSICMSVSPAQWIKYLGPLQAWLPSQRHALDRTDCIQPALGEAYVGGPALPTWALQQVGSYRRYTGRAADISCKVCRRRQGSHRNCRRSTAATNAGDIGVCRSIPGRAEKQHNEVAVEQSLFATKSMADFKCDTSNATKPESTRASRRKVNYSTAHERTAITYPHDDRPAVTDVCYANLRSKRESSMCGS
jgi:hypothetical protein